MTAEFWITTAAIVLGPITAVLIAQWLQVRERRRERQLFVFRALMSTRRAQLSPERVVALNLIEVEFSKKQKVLKEFKALIDLYGDTVRWRSVDEEINKKLSKDVDDQSVRLINEIAKCLGYEYDQIEIMRGGYYPEAFAIQEEEQKTIREFIVGLKKGTLAVPTAVVDVRHPQKILEQAKETQLVLEYANRENEKAGKQDG